MLEYKVYMHLRAGLFSHNSWPHIDCRKRTRVSARAHRRSLAYLKWLYSTFGSVGWNVVCSEIDREKKRRSGAMEDVVFLRKNLSCSADWASASCVSSLCLPAELPAGTCLFFSSITVQVEMYLNLRQILTMTPKTLYLILLMPIIFTLNFK